MTKAEIMDKILSNDQKSDKDKIELWQINDLMDEYMKECCLELMDFIAKKKLSLRIYGSDQSTVILSPDGRVMTKEQLFNDFL